MDIAKMFKMLSFLPPREEKHVNLSRSNMHSQVWDCRLLIKTLSFVSPQKRKNGRKEGTKAGKEGRRKMNVTFYGPKRPKLLNFADHTRIWASHGPARWPMFIRFPTRGELRNSRCPTLIGERRRRRLRRSAPPRGGAPMRVRWSPLLLFFAFCTVWSWTSRFAFSQVVSSFRCIDGGPESEIRAGRI